MFHNTILQARTHLQLFGRSLLLTMLSISIGLGPCAFQVEAATVPKGHVAPTKDRVVPETTDEEESENKSANDSDSDSDEDNDKVAIAAVTKESSDEDAASATSEAPAQGKPATAPAKPATAPAKPAAEPAKPAPAGTTAPAAPVDTSAPTAPVAPPAPDSDVVPAVEAPSSPPGTSVPQPAPATGSLAPVKAKTAGNPTFSLTLAGGGARGAAHIGVLKVLERHGLRPDFVAGSSMGAVVGALYCAGVPVMEIEKMFLDGRIKKAFIPTPVPLQALKLSGKYVARKLTFKDPPLGLYTGESVEKMMRKSLPYGRCRVEDFPRSFAAIATNILDTRPVWLAKGDAPQIVRASACLPLIYEPERYQDKELVDGGIRANLPTEPAEEAGSNVVVAVRMYATLNAVPTKSYKNFRSLFDRTISMLMAEIEGKATHKADVVIEPDIGNMPMYAFDPMSAAKAIAEGERAAAKMIPTIRQKMADKGVVAERDLPQTPPTAAPPPDVLPAGRRSAGTMMDVR